MQDLKIALIGATGKSGTYILKELLARNYQVKALVRNPEKINIHHPALEILTGNVNDEPAVFNLIKDCDAVISALGLGQPASEKNIFTQSTGHIIKIMERLGLKRYLVLTGINVNTPLDHKNVKIQFATNWMYDNYPLTTADKQKEYEMLFESTIDWTLLRLPLIIQTDESTTIGTSLWDCEGEQIYAANIASFLIEQLTSTTFIKQAPFIWNI